MKIEKKTKRLKRRKLFSKQYANLEKSVKIEKSTPLQSYKTQDCKSTKHHHLTPVP